MWHLLAWKIPGSLLKRLADILFSSRPVHRSQIRCLSEEVLLQVHCTGETRGHMRWCAVWHRPWCDRSVYHIHPFSIPFILHSTHTHRYRHTPPSVLLTIQISQLASHAAFQRPQSFRDFHNTAIANLCLSTHLLIVSIAILYVCSTVAQGLSCLFQRILHVRFTFKYYISLHRFNWSSVFIQTMGMKRMQWHT